MTDSAIQDRRNIRSSYADGAAFSVMVGFGETYLVAFALKVGISELTAGLLSSLPLIAGGLLQLAAPWCAQRFGSYRRWVVVCASSQALVYIPLALAASRGRIDTWVLFLLAALYWGAGMAAGPVWNNWIDAIIPKPRLKEFLAVRSRITQLAAFVAFLIGGLSLHVLASKERALFGFTVLFVAAGLFRIVSVYFLARQSDVVAKGELTDAISIGQAMGRFREPQTGRFLLFLLASQVSISVASPFFSPFMLGHVKFDYADYVWIVSAAYVAKIIFYPQVARFVRKVGAYRALWIAAIAVAPPPLFWYLTPTLPALIALQVIAGIAWAVFELSSTLLIYDRISPQERIRILTIYNVLNAAALVVGSALGGTVLSVLPGDTGYRAIFFASAALRLLSLTALFGMAKMKVRFRSLAFRTVGLRGSRFGMMAVPILLEDEPNRVSGKESAPLDSSPRKYPQPTGRHT